MHYNRMVIKVILYHGSDRIINCPIYGGGKVYNDYGQGFYCTERKELAKEWAARTEAGGYVNQYELDTDQLRALHLNKEPYHILHWLAVLLEHRRVRAKTPMMKRAMQFVTEQYSVAMEEYDLVIGYRADDSYFTFARDFLSNEISLGQLEYAMHMGNLGEQVVLISPKAFEQIHFLKYEIIDGKVYHRKQEERDLQARQQYMELLEKEEKEGLFIRDLMKGGTQI